MILQLKYMANKKLIKNEYASVALLWHNIKVLALLKVKCEIYLVRLNPVTRIPWATSAAQKN